MKSVGQFAQRYLIVLGLLVAVTPMATALPTSVLQKMREILPQSDTVAYVVFEDKQRKQRLFQNEVLINEGNVAVFLRILQEYQKTPSKIPKYDSRLNISEAKYKSYFKLTPHYYELTRPFKLPIVRTKQHIKFGDSPQLQHVFNGLKFNLKTGVLSMPEGFDFEITQHKISKNDPSPSDIVHFYVWRMYNVNNSPQNRNGVRGTVYLYQRRDGYIYLHNQRTSMIKGQTKMYDMILRYKPSSEHSP